jgi:hypothetical protein
LKYFCEVINDDLKMNNILSKHFMWTKKKKKKKMNLYFCISDLKWSMLHSARRFRSLIERIFESGSTSFIKGYIGRKNCFSEMIQCWFFQYLVWILYSWVSQLKHQNICYNSIIFIYLFILFWSVEILTCMSRLFSILHTSFVSLFVRLNS